MVDIDLTRLDISKINSYGKYVDLDTPEFFPLTDAQISFLRKYHGREDIAVNRHIETRRRETYSSGSNRRRVSLQKNQKYNKGNYVLKDLIETVGTKIVIGSLVVVVVASAFFALPGKKGEKVDIVAEEPTWIYTDAPHYSSNYNVEANVVPTVGDAMVSVDEKTERIVMIKKICDIYQVNYDVVYPKLKELTSDFTSEEFLNGRIAGVTCKSVEVQASSEEELLVYTIRCMKQLPHQLGVDKTNLYVKNGYNSGTDYYSQIDYAARVLGIDRCLLYAIVQSECGFNSPLFNNSNNPAGLKDPSGNGWWVFDSKEEGFLELGMEVVKYYRKIGATPDMIDAKTIAKLRDIHAPLDDGNENWLPNVLDCLAYAKMHEVELFGEAVDKELSK